MMLKNAGSELLKSKSIRSMAKSGKTLRAVFMGTPGFALPSLEMLLKEGYDIAAVITQPDKPKGRGFKQTAPPVAVFAAENGLKLLQPAKVRTADFADQLRALKADVFITAAYGRILTAEVLAIPPLGCVNVHASLLPELRGAAPIQWAVIRGYGKTGVTTMMTDEGMDTGDILLSCEVSISHEMNAGTLHDILAPAGAELLRQTLAKLVEGTLTRTPQDDSRATYAPPITQEHCRISWNQLPEAVCNLIRGLAPYPGAYCIFRGANMKIWKAEVIAETEKGSRHNGAIPGEILSAGRDGIKVACRGGSLLIIELQACSCRRMNAGEYICGHRTEAGEVLE